ncbi:hypothetical protein G7Y89_g15246 [Cudoniella acicularis]|uniref:HAT C-terminal dimerisation domain-containing protein n=1 Tax=Cudoniella acicularis TaxID=354080 RepID=A0A8H4VN98_9HELO|nr:hypothetical protein G7Y89_g15246 [Cudoniella acicularis]
MLEVAVALESVIYDYFETFPDYEVSKDELSTDDLDKLLPSMGFILAPFEAAKRKYINDPDTSILKTMVNLGLAKMEKYYRMTDDTPVYAAALLFNPTRKFQYIDKFWKESWKQPAKDAELWLVALDTPEHVLDEFDRYVVVDGVYGYYHAIDYWLEPSQKQQYLNLSKMALNILSILAMSEDPERAFSAAKIKITDRRNKLGA